MTVPPLTAEQIFLSLLDPTKALSGNYWGIFKGFKGKQDGKKPNPGAEAPRGILQTETAAAGQVGYLKHL